MTQCAENYASSRFASPALNEHGEEPMIRAENPLTILDWDRRVTSLPNRSFFHSSAWARVLEETYGFKPLYLIAQDGSNLRGVLPLMEVDSWLTGRRGVSLPFTDECPLIGTDPDAFGRLHQEALELGKSRGWKYLETRGGPAPAAPESESHAKTTLLQIHSEVRPSLSFYGHILDLTGGEALVQGRLTPPVRRAIRKSEAADVRVDISSSLQSVRVYYDLHCKTRKKQGVPPQSFTFFRQIQKHILAQNLGFVAIARLKETPIAAAVFFHFGRKAIYKYGASDETFLNFRGNNLVMWHAIQRCARAGLESLDFGRTSLSNQGLRRFKLSWGSQESAISYFKYDFRRGKHVAGRNDTMGWQNRIIGAFPIRLARLAGWFLYPHVA